MTRNFTKYSSYTESQYPWSQVKREHTSSQSDEEPEARRERRKRKKSRWSDEPPSADIKPPGVVVPMPGTLVPTGKLRNRVIK